MASIKNIKIGTATYTIKADFDGDGNKIIDTYATKNEVTTNITNKLGVVNGIATLDASGKVPSSLLPSFVDDIIESDTKATFPETGEDSKIYVDKQTNKTYRWSGTEYVEVSSSLALGETAGTAYEGSKGKATTDIVNTHVGNTENPHQVTKAQVGLSDVDNTSDKNKPLSDAAKEALNKKVNIVEGKELSSNDFTDTLKSKLEGIEEGALVNKITGVKGDSEEAYRIGNVNITKANIGLSNVDNTADTDKPISTAAQTVLDKKVDKETGKGLSTNDYTTAEKNKLAAISATVTGEILSIVTQ